MDPVVFTTDFNPGATADDQSGCVLAPGKLFEAGEYPDKQFAMTVSEIDAEAARFNAAGKPAPMNVEHRPSVLDGSLGEIRSLEADGSALTALFAVPKWLRDLARAKGVPLRVSAEFDRATKQLRAAAWVLNPRVTDAQLIAAFSASEKKPAPTTKKSVPGKDIHMTRKELIAAAIAAGDADTASALFAEQEAETAAAAAAAKAAEARLATFADSAKTAIAERAAAFADRQIVVEKRAFPCERANIIAQFTQAAQDDIDHAGVVTFSDAGKQVTGSRVDALAAAFAVRPAHGLDQEWLDPNQDAAAIAKKFKDFTAKFSEGGMGAAAGGGGAEKVQPLTEERRQELLGKTTTGRAVLAEARK